MVAPLVQTIIWTIIFNAPANLNFGVKPTQPDGWTSRTRPKQH